MKQKRISAGEFVFLGVILCYVAYYAVSIRDYALKAAMWPYILMGAAAVLITAIVIDTLWKGQKAAFDEDALPGEQTKAEERTVRTEKNGLGGWVKAQFPTIFMIVSFVLYILLVRLLGFILCTFALIFAQMLFLSKGKVLKALIIAAVVSVAFYVIFRVIIGARLPTFSLF